MIISKVRQIRATGHMKRLCKIEENVEFGDHAWGSGEKFSIEIGHDSFINCVLTTQDSGRIKIGPYSWIGGGAFTAIGSLSSVTIGSHVIISNHVHIYDNNNHPTSPRKRREMCESGFFNDNWKWKYSEASPITIESNVWIGEYSMILKGVTIGEGSIIAAHTVVTKDVPPYSIVAGNPGKVVKRLDCDDIKES